MTNVQGDSAEIVVSGFVSSFSDIAQNLPIDGIDAAIIATRLQI